MSCASISRRRRSTSSRCGGSAFPRRGSGSCHPTAGTRSAPSPTASPCTGSIARARRSMRSALRRTRSSSRSAASRMKFCANCGAGVVRRVPPGDTLERWVCEHCGEIHYQNPKLVIGTVPEREGKVLLCRRAIEPRYGYWTLPAGFMENDETTGQAALRAKAPRIDPANTAWMIVAAALVLFMTLPGLALFYAGLVRAKNALSVLMQCFAITCIVTLAWVIVGYSIAFGDGGAANGWWGGLG